MPKPTMNLKCGKSPESISAHTNRNKSKFVLKTATRDGQSRRVESILFERNEPHGKCRGQICRMPSRMCIQTYRSRIFFLFLSAEPCTITDKCILSNERRILGSEKKIKINVRIHFITCLASCIACLSLRKCYTTTAHAPKLLLGIGFFRATTMPTTPKKIRWKINFAIAKQSHV